MLDVLEAGKDVLAEAGKDVVAEALAGLAATPKTLPAKLFYDAEGVRLFEAITRLPEYYLTRTETALLRRIAPELAALAPARGALVEYGASDAAKARLLLNAPGADFAAYVPIDVADSALQSLAARLRVLQPDLAVHPLCGDFTQNLMLPRAVRGMRKFGFFPGSTIGNFAPEAARRFLAQARRTLGSGAWLVVGADFPKDENMLLNAYDDATGVTAAFNLNVLRRLNREAGADFALGMFEHEAVWNDRESRVEMHLRSGAAQCVRIAGTTVRFEAGESIHTENSYKHGIAAFQAMAALAGWTPAHVWTDADGLFSVHALQAGEVAGQAD
jgi:dimethylhistidine N-methyltransferase